MKIKKFTILTILMMVFAMVCLSGQTANAVMVASDDIGTTDEASVLTVPATGVLTNDTGTVPLLVISFDNPSANGATVTGNADGSYSYDPNGQFEYLAFGESTTDTFGYTARDNDPTQDTATVTITINGVNDTPTANNDTATLAEDSGANGIDVLADDTDPDTNDTLLITVVTQGTHGSVLITGGGTGLTYEPDADYFGSDIFTYTISDGNGGTDTATVNVTVSSVNDPPVAADEGYSIDEDNTLDVAVPGVLGNDSDPVEGDSLQAVLVTGVSNGSLTLNADGSFTYTPDADFNGTDAFTYQADDQQSANNLSNIATVTITVNSVNDLPIATDDGYSVDEDNTLNVAAPSGVLTNDDDSHGGAPNENNIPLTATLVSDVSSGSLTLNNDGSFTYIPNADFNGTDTFTYTATDSLGGVSNTATVTITVTSVNDPPVANDDAYNIDEDNTLNIAVPGVLTNDSDPVEGDSLQAVLVTDVSNGSLTLNSDGSFTYTPDADFNGIDTFTYQADDQQSANNLSNIATVTITVNSVNDLPIATDDGYSVDEDNTLNVAAASGVLTNDDDSHGGAPDENNIPLTATLVSDVSSGSLTLNNDGSFTYTPNGDFNGTDTFTYTATDSLGGVSNIATVTITINLVNDPPVAVDESYSIDEDNTLDVAAPGVLSNDSDPVEGDSLQAVLVTDVTNGSLTLNSDGSFTYTPDADFNGTDTFTYQADDQQSANNLSNIATVTITVNSVNDPPIATDDGYSVDEDNTLNVAAPSGVLTNDDDSHGGAPDENNIPLTATLVTNVSDGSLTLNNNGSFTYIPNGDFNGTDTFTYTATDSLGGVSNIATVTITINLVNDPPVANDDAYNIDEDNTLNIAVPGVLGNDSDPVEGNSLQAVLVTDVINGSLTLNSDGSFTYTPGANFNGTDSFTYQADDQQSSNNLSNIATVTITANSVNDPPIATDDGYSVDEDNILNVAAASGVLSNDDDSHGGAPDEDNTPLTATLVADVSSGSLTLNNDGSFTYNPNTDFNGTDTFTYAATDSQGGVSNTATVTIGVNSINDPPVADFSGAPTSGAVPLTVAFTDNSTDVDIGDSIVSWSWDFGDGSPVDTTSNPTHIYTSAGTYTVTLTVTDSAGATDDETKTDYITSLWTLTIDKTGTGVSVSTVTAGAGSDPGLCPGGTAPGMYLYKHGDVVTLTAIDKAPPSGSEFQGWTGDVANTSAASTTTTMNGDKTVTADFIGKYSIISIQRTGGTITPLGERIVYYGDNQAYSISINGGYTNSDVVVDGSSQGPLDAYTFSNITTDHEIIAVFTAGDVPYTPPQAGDDQIYNASVPPLVMLIMGRSHKLYYEAYNDASDLNEDGTLDVGYNPNIDYYGYFDSYKVYTYDSTDQRFEPVRTTIDKKTSGNPAGNEWSGDYLNYLTMTRMDTLRKVLYGGYRSTDTATETVLQRVFIPQDAHSWGKEYESITRDGYDIKYYAPHDTPSTGTRHLFASTTLSDNGDPLLRVLPNNTHRIWDWVAKERPVCDSSLGTPADYVVKVLVGVSSMPEGNCKQYPDGAYKPIGILQKHGEAGRMNFGLLTGSYANNTSGGVLRKPIGSITDEIDPSTGQLTSVNGIIKTIDAFRICEFRYSDYSYEPGWPAAWVTTRNMDEGEFPDWGNPIAEMMYEGLRYFAGKKTPTTKFDYGPYTNCDNNFGLPKPAWDDPYETHDYCAKPFLLVLSDIYPNNDSDQLPGSYWYPSPALNPDDLTGLHVQNLADFIFTEEGAAASHYIGQQGGTFDSSCTPKDVDGFGDIRGLCPEEPTKQGSYYSASVAYFGRTQDINPTESDQNVVTFVVGLASPLPRINIQVGTGEITLVPVGKSCGGCLGIQPTEGAFQPNNTIVDFFVEAITPTSGTFRINYEDVENAADHDMDAIVIYHYQVVDDNLDPVTDASNGTKVQITLTSEYASGCIIQHIGYIISGTTKDGTYLEVRDSDTGAGTDPDYFMDTPPGVWFGDTGDPPPWEDGADLPLVTTRIFDLGTSAAATLLNDPLWYAAKWGGFIDLDDNDKPDLDSEWDEDADGVPDTYFYVVNPLKLEQQLNRSFTDILSRGVSHVAPVVSVDEANRTQSGDELYMAFFKPIPDAYWQGNLKKYGLEYLTRDDCGRTVPEWTVVDRNGDIAGDCEGKFYGSSDSYWSTNDGGYVDSGGAGGKLKDAIDNVSLASGPYYNFRNIYTYKGNQSGSLVSFTSANITNTDLEVSTDSMRHKIINYVYGYTFDAEATTGYPTAKRDWILGDIIHSEPKVIDYLDGDYALEYRFIAIGANDGMLHVFTDMACTIDGQSYDAGEEIFAFVPGDLLSNLQECASTYTHIYMVDGSATLLRAKTYDDDNSDGLRNTGEYYDKTLVFGERRGGRSYWALDITEPDPSLWEVKGHIQGGTGGITTDRTQQIDELGFTWSKPRFARLRTAFDTVKYVAIFAGGYDPQEDGFPEGFEDSDANGAWDSGESNAVTVGGTEGYDKYNPDKNSMGRGIYVVDVDDGSLLFSATYDETDLTTGTDQTYSDMRYCFPADISVIPISETNLVMYAADIYGQIWKTTYNYFGSEKWTVSLVFQSNPGSDLPTGDTDIGNAALNSNDTGRKTFYSPDVSYFGNCWTKKPVLYFGTGDRAHPRNTMISNRFYAVADYNGQPDVTKETDLLNLTCNELEDENMVDADNDGDIDGDDVTRQYNLKAILQTPSQCRGFYRVLDKQGNCSAESISHVGEHVLCTPTLFFGNVFFTSYQPVFDDPCIPEGNAFIYAIDYCWGTSVFNYNKNNDPSGNTNRDITDTYQKIAAGSIPSAVTIITRGGHPASLVSAGGALVGAGEDLSTNIPGPPGGVSQMWWKTD